MGFRYPKYLELQWLTTSEGIESMRNGGRHQLLCSPAPLCYGASGILMSYGVPVILVEIY